MLKVRIIPKLLLREGRNVKGVRFTALRDTGNPVTNARIYDAQGADELIFLDIQATPNNRALLFDLITKTAQEVFMPFCVGGGVTDVRHVRDLLKAGADKVAINTASVERPGVIADAARVFGSQCVVGSIDFRRGGRRHEVFTHGGAKPTGLDVLEHARNVVSLGAGELLLTSIDRDGTMEGYDLDVTSQVATSLNVPVIASGGAGTLQHLVEAIEAGAAAVAVGSLFHFTDQSPIKARMYMRTAGIDVRLEA